MAGRIWPMWYSSQKMTNTRMSSRAASAAACSGDRIGSDSVVGRRLAVAPDELERVDRLRDAVLADVEVVLRQIGDRLALVIDDGDVHAHRWFGAGAEGRALLFRRLGVAAGWGSSRGWAGGCCAVESRSQHCREQQDERAGPEDQNEGAKSGNRPRGPSSLCARGASAVGYDVKAWRPPARGRSCRTRAARRTTSRDRRRSGWPARSRAASRCCADACSATAPTR